MDDSRELSPGRPLREPAITAPWVVLLLIGLLIGAHVLRVLTGADPDRFALTSEDLIAGRYGGLVTYQFVHGNWAHVLLNSAFILAFGAPVARFFGPGPRGALVFLGFFVVAGVAAAVLYAAMPSALAAGSQPWALVGASGSASGLMGAAARLIGGRGRAGPIFSRGVLGMGFAWIIINVVLGVSGLTPGAGDAPVAWQAHIFGFVCGVLLIGIFGRLAGAPRDHANAL